MAGCEAPLCSALLPQPQAKHIGMCTYFYIDICVLILHITQI